MSNNKIILPSIHLLLNDKNDYPSQPIFSSNQNEFITLPSEYNNKYLIQQPNQKYQFQQKQINPNQEIEKNEPSFNRKAPIKKCKKRNCYLCTHVVPKYLMKKPTWENKILVAFYSICRNKDKDTTSLVSLKRDLYPFIEEHAHLLFLRHKIQNKNWRKQLQDILNHKKYIFESGVKEMKGSTGYWKIKYPFIDPWKLETTAKKTIQTYKRLNQYYVNFN